MQLFSDTEMTPRQARAITATGLKFGDQKQIDAIRVLCLGFEIRAIDLRDYEKPCPQCIISPDSYCEQCGRGERCHLCGGRSGYNPFARALIRLDDTDENDMVEMLKEMKEALV